MDAILRFVEFLESIPVICRIGLLYGIAICLLPLGQFIMYRSWVKKYGKEEADEMARRW